METNQVPSTISIQTLDKVREVLGKTKGWLALLSIASVVWTLCGIVILLLRVGVVGFVFLGLASGILTIALAVFLFQASQRAKRYAQTGKAEALTAYHGKLKTYFTLTGLLLAAVMIWRVIVALVGGLQGILT